MKTGIGKFLVINMAVLVGFCLLSPQALGSGAGIYSAKHSQAGGVPECGDYEDEW
jgi:hypothetical protein